MTNTKIQGIIKKHADFRDEYTPSTHHYTGGHVRQILDEVDEAKNEEHQTDDNSPSIRKDGERHSEVESQGQSGSSGQDSGSERGKIVPFSNKEYATLGEQAGVKFLGTMGEEFPQAAIATFQDPQSGTSIGVKLKDFSPEQLQKQIADARERMAATR